jgi:hypothetical protein
MRKVGLKLSGFPGFIGDEANIHEDHPDQHRCYGDFLEPWQLLNAKTRII